MLFAHCALTQILFLFLRTNLLADSTNVKCWHKKLKYYIQNAENTRILTI